MWRFVFWIGILFLVTSPTAAVFSRKSLRPNPLHKPVEPRVYLMMSYNGATVLSSDGMYSSKAEELWKYIAVGYCGCLSGAEPIYHDTATPGERDSLGHSSTEADTKYTLILRAFTHASIYSSVWPHIQGGTVWYEHIHACSNRHTHTDSHARHLQITLINAHINTHQRGCSLHYFNPHKYIRKPDSRHGTCCLQKKK